MHDGHRWTFAGLLVLSLALPAGAQGQAFEGVVTYTIRADQGEEHTVVQMSKAGKIRQDFTENGRVMSLISDQAAGTLTTLMPEQKMYMVMRREDMQRMMKGIQDMAQGMGPTRSDSSARRPQGSFTRTGRTAVVAGVTCEIFAFAGTDSGQREKGEACVAKGTGVLLGSMGFGFMAGPQRRRPATGLGPAEQLLTEGYGLLRITREVEGKTVTVLEVTSIQRKSVAEDQFQPPAGYREMNMGNMMPGRPNPDNPN